MFKVQDTDTGELFVVYDVWYHEPILKFLIFHNNVFKYAHSDYFKPYTEEE